MTELDSPHPACDARVISAKLFMADSLNGSPSEVVSSTPLAPMSGRGMLTEVFLLPAPPPPSKNEVARRRRSARCQKMMRVDDFPQDLERLRTTLSRLQASGFYYEGLSWQEANDLLQDQEEGRFLVRDSSDSAFLFSLSVKTRKGPTSIRIHYNRGEFRLDSEDRLVNLMPRYDCVLKLVEHYTLLSLTPKGTSCVWLDESGKRDLPILLGKPLYKKVNSLQHLCRLKLNSSRHAVHSNLPAPIRRTDVHDGPRAGRPSVSDETIAKVEAAMLEDRRITVRKLCDLVPDVSKTTIDKILHEHLGYSKVCAIWVPKMLTEDHERQRVDAAQKFLDCHETDGEEFLDSIVTGDVIWVHYNTPETKEQSKQWKHTSSPKNL
ncbi:SOCS2 [Cordylochernes scorpioides]|uniref:SOCS2 n=1 Tax=Cordylochernes scorpioides TaxID=51811 RepID=A0ABY6LB28_9ARAC|nr:SOCS2 [Cordylochernes scorpioides]